MVVIACAMFFDLKSKVLEELWINFGSGKHFRQICIHQIAHKLGEQKSKALLGFHSFSGCDTVSYFSGREKTVMWKIWKLYPDVTEAFLYISQPQSIITNDMKISGTFHNTNLLSI